MQSLWMLFAAFMFSVMAVGVKYASAFYSAGEMVAARGLVGALFLGGLALAQGRSLATAHPGAHLARGIIGVIALGLWFHAFAGLPLAMATTLNYTAPIWMAAILLIGGLWTGDKHAEWPLVLAILASFGGVLMLLQPSIEGNSWPYALEATSSGFLSSIAYLQVRKLGKLGEPEYRVVFYFSLICFAAGLGGAMLGPDAAKTHSLRSLNWSGIGLLLWIGICATIAQVAMTRAYRFGKPLVNGNLQYGGIVFASVFGVVLWDDRLGWLGWGGIAVIMASGIVTTFFMARPEAAAAPAPDKIIANEI